jgi:ABC-2 type transport system ATP-binding protein
VLFLDEPSSGLDPQNRVSLWDHVRALRARGTTVFLTTHYLEEADALCDRLTIIDHGQIITTGNAAELKRGVGGDTITIELRDAAEACCASDELRSQRGVHETHTDGSQLRLLVADGGAILPQLMRELDAAGIASRSISVSEPTLDDVFLRHTGRSLRDSGTTAAYESETAAVAA